MTPLRLSIQGVRIEPHAVAPTLVFTARADTDPSVPVHAIALRCQLQIDPRQRRYGAPEADRLYEVFGTRSQWTDSLRPLLWAQLSVMVPSFQTAIEFAMPVPCTCDLEVAAGRYFSALDDGDIPLTFLFSGLMFCSVDDGLRVVPVSWDLEAAYRLPLDVWRRLMAPYFPEGAWLRLGRVSLDRLRAFQRRHALPTTDAALDQLLEQAAQGEPA